MIYLVDSATVKGDSDIQRVIERIRKRIAIKRRNKPSKQRVILCVYDLESGENEDFNVVEGDKTIVEMVIHLPDHLK